MMEGKGNIMSKHLVLRAVLILGIGLCLLFAGLAASLYLEQSGRETEQPVVVGKVELGGPFALIDQTGELRRSEEFAGGYMLIFFGYTYCPDVCPTSLLQMTQALDLLAEQEPEKAAAVTPLFITVDPARDSVEAMRDYSQNFHPRLVALTGSEEEIAQVASAYRVYYQKAEGEGEDDYLMDHSSIIYLMGPTGEYVTHFSHQTTVEEMVAALADKVRP
jgi:cytochrome oxidase Cu insertion factor (SCO1/SenC/PrrC family)